MHASRKNLAYNSSTFTEGERRYQRIWATITPKVKRMVEEDNLLEAAELLSELIEACQPIRCIEISGIIRRINAIQARERRGELSYEEINRERARITNALLELLD